MCGIMGYNGKQNAIPIVIKGLKSLEYRGYDSAGIAYLKDENVKIIKEKGRITELEKLLDDDSSNTAIGHTRWATHGSPNRINAHPHNVGDVIIVHNGIIENYSELKEKLISNGYTFKSETDTEVACAVIDSIYKETNDKIKTIEKLKDVLKGSYAFLILFKNDNKIYTTRCGSPLILASNIDGNYIASDIPAILPYTKEYYLLDEGEIGIVDFEKIEFIKNGNIIKKEKLTFNFSVSEAELVGYKHFMLKEINEQPHIIKEFLDYYFENFDLIKDISKYKKIHIVACGSAYHAGLIGKYLIEKYGHIETNVYIASEYRYSDNFITKDTLVILVSQSGETADTIASLRLAKECKAGTLGIVNVVGSTIARESDEVIYINAGCEIAVATTKAYTNQVLTFSLLAYKLGIKNGLISNEDALEIKKEYYNLPNEINKILKLDYKSLASKIYKQNDIFFIGRLIDYYLCLEGSLKLKEISYIHSETYAAGELKHGTISLIDEGTPVVSIVTDTSICEKTVSNINETKARGANVILVKRKSLVIDETCYDELIEITDMSDLVIPMLSIVPLQLLAYHVADLKGLDIDKPKNLAKSVTVE
ncbi:MAG: glutamine--fructose-6-phosphate transaminase (isomerizing) [Bacilli bacterium]|nr:glutamine--fructose-6-phosphate transaminase (isomerizing) [Bacilli bacterium]